MNFVRDFNQMQARHLDDLHFPRCLAMERGAHIQTPDGEAVVCDPYITTIVTRQLQPRDVTWKAWSRETLERLNGGPHAA